MNLDTDLAQSLVDGDVLQQAVREHVARVVQRRNPKRNAERKALRAERDTGHATQKLPVARQRTPASTALRMPDGSAYTLVGRKLIEFPDGTVASARREWKPTTELVHRVGLPPQDAAGKKVERLRNESAVSKRMRRPIRDTWLNGGMGKLMAFAKIGGAHAPVPA